MLSTAGVAWALKMVRPGSWCGHLVMCEPAVNGCSLLLGVFV